MSVFGVAMALLAAAIGVMVGLALRGQKAEQRRGSRVTGERFRALAYVVLAGATATGLYQNHHEADLRAKGFVTYARQACDRGNEVRASLRVVFRSFEPPPNPQNRRITEGRRLIEQAIKTFSDVNCAVVNKPLTKQ